MSNTDTRALHIALIAAGFAMGCTTDGELEQTSVAAIESPPPHCVAPWGVDWNKELQVDDAAIVSPFCTKVRTGDAYTPEVLWITNTDNGIEGGPVLYPPGYTPLHKGPMRDFLHKLTGVRYLVKPGNLQFSFAASEIRRTVTVADLFEGSDEFTGAQMAWPATALVGELMPLRPGSYRADIHFVMSAMHCDGQTTDPAVSCLPAGDSFVLSREFVVE